MGYFFIADTPSVFKVYADRPVAGPHNEERGREKKSYLAVTSFFCVIRLTTTYAIAAGIREVKLR